MPDDEKPPERPTVQTPAVTPEQIMQTQMRQLLDGVGRANANIDLLANDMATMKDRVAIVETRQNDSESRASRFSDRAREASSTDLSHEAKIAAEVIAREQQIAAEAAERTKLAERVKRIEIKTDAQTVILTTIQTTVSSLAKHPLVKQAAVAFLTFLIGLLTAHGAK